MNKIVSIKETSAIFLAVILVTGTITLFSPSFMTTASAQSESYYGMDNNNYKSQYGQDKYKTKDNVVVKKINCNNVNVNVNGLELNGLPSFLSGLLASAAEAADNEGQYGANSYVSYGGGQSGTDKDFRFICINNNNNTVIEEEPIPSTTASLTVKKQVFGCDNFDPIEMDCNFQNNSEEWLDCNNSAISGTIFCQSLPESIFDIEVLDDQNNQIQQFEGSEQGTTIQNLEPGTYTVNEILHESDIDQLGVNDIAQASCISNFGFTNGGEVFNSTSIRGYNPLCFEYEDEQGNDCSTITLAAGEERTCIVKNYIVNALGN